MPESQHLAWESQFSEWIAWDGNWKAILLASGVPHDGSTAPARFLLSEHDDHALAVLVRTTIDPGVLGDPSIVNSVTAKPIFFHLSVMTKNDVDIEIVYASELSKEEAGRFLVHGAPVEVIERKVEAEADEDFVELEHSCA